MVNLATGKIRHWGKFIATAGFTTELDHQATSKQYIFAASALGNDEDKM